MHQGLRERPVVIVQSRALAGSSTLLELFRSELEELGQAHISISLNEKTSIENILKELQAQLNLRPNEKSSLTDQLFKELDAREICLLIDDAHLIAGGLGAFVEFFLARLKTASLVLTSKQAPKLKKTLYLDLKLIEYQSLSTQEVGQLIHQCLGQSLEASSVEEIWKLCQFNPQLLKLTLANFVLEREPFDLDHFKQLLKLEKKDHYRSIFARMSEATQSTLAKSAAVAFDPELSDLIFKSLDDDSLAELFAVGFLQQRGEKVFIENQELQELLLELEIPREMYSQLLESLCALEPRPLKAEISILIGLGKLKEAAQILNEHCSKISNAETNESYRRLASPLWDHLSALSSYYVIIGYFMEFRDEEAIALCERALQKNWDSVDDHHFMQILRIRITLTEKQYRSQLLKLICQTQIGSAGWVFGWALFFRSLSNLSDSGRSGLFFAFLEKHYTGSSAFLSRIVPWVEDALVDKMLALGRLQEAGQLTVERLQRPNPIGSPLVHVAVFSDLALFSFRFFGPKTHMEQFSQSSDELRFFRISGGLQSTKSLLGLYKLRQGLPPDPSSKKLPQKSLRNWFVVATRLEALIRGSQIRPALNFLEQYLREDSDLVIAEKNLAAVLLNCLEVQRELLSQVCGSGKLSLSKHLDSSLMGNVVFREPLFGVLGELNADFFWQAWSFDERILRFLKRPKLFNYLYRPSYMSSFAWSALLDGRFKLAEDWFQEVIELSEAQDLFLPLGRALMGMGLIRMNSGQAREALAFFRRAQGLCSEMQEGKERKLSQLLVALCLLELGNRKDAEAILEAQPEPEGFVSLNHFVRTLANLKPGSDEGRTSHEQSFTSQILKICGIKKQELWEVHTNKAGLQLLDREPSAKPACKLYWNHSRNTLKLKASEELSLADRPAVEQLLLFLMSRPNEFFSKEELIGIVWKEKYNPLVHDSRIYTTVRRARQLFREALNQEIILMSNGLYGINTEVPYELVRKQSPRQDLNPRQRWILEFLEVNPYLDRQTAERVLKLSSTQVKRELKELCDRALVIREGKARATRYHLANRMIYAQDPTHQSHAG
ncbi:MAG: helix-turn-helix domain-containing protein [Bradymonadales bacterium]|nr:MAG: helix-turn-helix domain-containing protein [Bradymonadales bacterium]